MKFFTSFKFKRVYLLTSLRIVTIIVTITIGIAVVGIGFFLYTYFYKTITQSEEIFLLRQEVAPESIDIVQVKKTIDNLEKKENSPIPPAHYSNHFIF